MTSPAGPPQAGFVELGPGILDGFALPEPEAAGETRAGVQLALGWFGAHERPLSGFLGLMDWRLAGQLSHDLRAGWACGDPGALTLRSTARSGICDFLLMCGLGTGEEPTQVQACGRSATLAALGLRPRTVLVAVHRDTIDRALGYALLDGVRQALHDRELRSGPHPAAIWIGADRDTLGRYQRHWLGPPRPAAPQP